MMRLPAWAIGIAFLFFLGFATAESTTTAPAKNDKPTPKLTGIPQIDYIHDPNLPRELKGYDLSTYPFYNRLPENMYNFTCDNRHDGFYASIPHKCQVYHNCLFGVRYDFLCANFTAFDQSNFICHFASEVDCKHSELYFDRNELLYKEATTTTEKPKYRPHPRKPGGRRKNKKTTPKPPPEDEYYDYYYDDEYYDEPAPTTTTTTTTTTTPTVKLEPLLPLKRKRLRPGQKRSGNRRPGGKRGPGGRRRRPGGKRPRRKKTTTTTTTTTTTPAPEYYDEYYDDEYYYYDDEPAPSSTTTTTTTEPPRRRLKSTRRRRPNQANTPSRAAAAETPAEPRTESRPSPAVVRRGQPIGSRAAEPVPDPSQYDDYDAAQEPAVSKVEQDPSPQPSSPRRAQLVRPTRRRPVNK